MKKILANLSVRQRISIGVIALAVAAGLFALVHWKKESNYKPLFTGMPAEEASAIVQKLKENGAEYRLADGGKSILVPSEKIPELRLTLAGAGYPKSGRIGYEIFDKTNLGSTEFAEHVNYRRALEGELERSVMSLAEVEQARVHVTFPKESVFLEEQKPAKASVLVRLKPNAKLKPQNVKAIDNLVASAVEGLSPDDVSVLDVNGNLLGKPKSAGSPGDEELSEQSIAYRRKIENDLLTKINTTLEPLLGAEKFRAGVSVDCDFSVGDQSEELYDPARTVMLSSQRSEDSSAQSQSAGVPGSASNLPRANPRAGGSNRITRATENVTYQPSRTVKKTHLPMGGIRKISVGVLVDQTVTWQLEGYAYKRVLTPPTAESLKSIRDIVAGVIGFSAERGDQLNVETLPFETTLLIPAPKAPAPPVTATPRGQPAEPGKSAPARKLDLPPFLKDRRVQMIIGGALALLALLGAAFVVLRKRRKGQQPTPTGTAAAPAALPAGEAEAEAIGPATPEQQLEAKLAERDAMQRKLEAQALGSIKIAPAVTKASEVLAKHLREKIQTDPQLASQILQSWIRDEEEIP